MRKERLLLIAFVMTAACRESQPFENRDTDRYIRALAEQGFRPDMIVDRGAYFVVEGDILIPKANLVTLVQTQGRNAFGIPSFQWRTTNLVSSSGVTYITMNLSGLQTSWQTAMRDAMAEWNSITPGAVMKFYEATSGQITATMTSNLDPGVVAQASWPSSGQPGPTILVANQFTQSLNSAQKKRNMAHELGHTIGLRHTNWQTNDCQNPPCSAGSIGAWQICSTPQTDAASVMNGSTGLVEWGGFSYEDKHAAFCLYPREPSWIVPSFSYSGDALASWDPLPDAPEYQIVMSESGWQIHDGEQYPLGTTLFISSWSSTPQITITGYPYTGYTSCSDGDGSHEGDWYKQLDTWVSLRYADGFTDQKTLLESPAVMPCP